MILLLTDPSVSNLHSSRRVFEILNAEGLETAVIHHFQTSLSEKDELALEIGMRVGSLLTDGNGDGVLLEQVGDFKPFSVDFLRTSSFSLLQGCRMRNTK